MTYLKFLRRATDILNIARSERIECYFSARITAEGRAMSMITLGKEGDFHVAMYEDNQAESKLMKMKAQVELMVFNARQARTNIKQGE